MRPQDHEPPLPDLLDFAVNIAREAGDVTRNHFQRNAACEWKPDGTPVTVADRSSEELLRRRITERFPDHGIVGEEFGEQQGRAPARWIIDPIDGTFSFICGVPLYSVLVGLEWADEMVVGVIHLPALDETVFAARGLGCFFRSQGGESRSARVSDVQDLSRARLLTTDVKLIRRHGRGPAFERLLNACAAQRGWCDGYAYALLATGRAEIVLDPAMSLWDIAPLWPVVTEAGGTLTDWSGRPTHTANEAIATNGALFDAVMAALRG
jgi:histidinol-phosphatase